MRNRRREYASKRLTETIEIGIDRAIADMVAWNPEAAKAVHDQKEGIVSCVRASLARDWKVVERAHGERTAT